MKKLKKIIATLMAVIATVSALGTTAMAKDFDAKSEATLRSLMNRPIGYTTDENGNYVLQYADGVMPASVDSSYKVYLYGTGSSSDDTILMNRTHTFNCYFPSSCTIYSKFEPNFGVGATNSLQRIYFKASGTSGSLNITIGDQTKTLAVGGSSIYFNGLAYGVVYELEINPAVGGSAIDADITMSGTAL